MSQMQKALKQLQDAKDAKDKMKGKDVAKGDKGKDKGKGDKGKDGKGKDGKGKDGKGKDGKNKDGKADELKDKGDGNRIADGKVNNTQGQGIDGIGMDQFLQLPPRQRELIRQALTGNLPPDYAAQIQQYYLNICAAPPSAQGAPTASAAGYQEIAAARPCAGHNLPALAKIDRGAHMRQNDSAATTLDETSLEALYEQDETAWLEIMAALAAHQRHEEMDMPHLSEYLTDMAKRDRREVFSRPITLMAHLLKWQLQPDNRSKSWRGTIREQRRELRQLLESGTLLNHAKAVLADAFAEARQQVADEADLNLDDAPTVCPWTVEDLLDDANS